MKKLLVSSLSVVALAVLGTGCLKDKDYENQSIGTQVQDSRAISFPQSRSASSIVYGVVSSADPITIQGPWIAMEAPNAQSSDTHITLTVDDALVTADPTLTILPPSEYSFDLSRTITAGNMLDSILISFPHSGNLDPNIKYGIGLDISSADNGFTVASNMSKLLLIFTVKNKYDGVYTVSPGLTSTTGGFVDYTNAAFTGLLPFQIRVVTTGPSSAIVTRLINGNWDPGYVFSTGASGSYYGNFGLVLNFDPATDEIIEMHNYYGDPANPITGVGDPSGGSGAPNYEGAPPRKRQAQLDPTGINAWDGSGANPVVDIKYFMIQADVATFPGPRSAFDEHWDYTGPRP